MQRAAILAIGTELTLGQTVDTNTAWLAGQLAAIGIRAARHLTVADERTDIRDALLEAAGSFDLLLASGGLGPTADDLTRHALAEAAGVELVLDPLSLEQIRAFFARRNRPMPTANRVQAMIPRGGRAIENTCGTAPGIFIELRGRPCWALPGVPFEMQAMFTRDVLPGLRAAVRGRVLRTRVLHCFGLGESDIGERIADLMQRGRNPEVGTTASLGVISIRINAAADSEVAATALLDDAERELRTRLGQVVCGRDEDTLASVVGELLLAAGATLATAESCTGGLLGKLLTDISGSSRYYLGGVVSYADEAKKKLLGLPADLLAEHGAVSAPVAREMAASARRVFSSTYAISVTGIAGPTGGTPVKPVGLVYLGLASPDGLDVRELQLGSDSPREVIRARAAGAALNLLRRKLLELRGDVR